MERGRLVIITPPLDPTTLPLHKRRPDPLTRNPDQPYRIVYVGRLADEKGIGTLIEAARGLTFPYSLEIFGDGSGRPALEALVASSGMASAVTFHGWQSQADIFDAFLASDLFVHPARWPEPAGRTVLEAMALGIPMVVSSVGGPPWIAGDAALTFSPGHADELRARIVQLHDDPSLASRLAQAGRERVKEFGLDHILQQLTELYREVQGLPVQPAALPSTSAQAREPSARVLS
jgi:glycosyltransferase involved in cell wall biosynthesis